MARNYNVSDPENPAGSVADDFSLIPILGMLAYFVNGYVTSNVLTPNFILVLFVTSVLATVWAIATLLAYHRARHSAIFVAIVDLGFVGALIAGVVELRGIATANCVTFNDGNQNDSFYNVLGPFGGFSGSFGYDYGANFNKNCAMLKACFALGIMNCVFFAITCVLALLLHRRNQDVVVRETHVHRHGSRRSGSHHSRNSTRTSRRRNYYV